MSPNILDIATQSQPKNTIFRSRTELAQMCTCTRFTNCTSPLLYNFRANWPVKGKNGDGGKEGTPENSLNWLSRYVNWDTERHSGPVPGPLRHSVSQLLRFSPIIPSDIRPLHRKFVRLHDGRADSLVEVAQHAESALEFALIVARRPRRQPAEDIFV